MSLSFLTFIVWIFFFFFNDTATTEIYTSLHTLSLHDALPIFCSWARNTLTREWPRCLTRSEEHTSELQSRNDISYAVFCLKKKKKRKPHGEVDRVAGTRDVYGDAAGR